MAHFSAVNVGLENNIKTIVESLQYFCSFVKKVTFRCSSPFFKHVIRKNISVCHLTVKQFRCITLPTTVYKSALKP